MKISIVTISFNQARFLERAILSVLNQGYHELEYIVVDPGSTDGSRDVIEKYRDRIRHVIYEKDDGPADGLNKGFACATGDVFGFLNADDELMPGALGDIAAAFRESPRADVISGCGYFVNEEGERLRAIVPSRLTPWLYAHGGVSVFQQGTFFKSDFFRVVGGFNVNNLTCWDGELFLDMAMAGARFVAIGSDLAYFRLHEGSITGSGRLNEKYRLDCDRLFEKATGREPGQLERIYGWLARLVKLAANPPYLVRRLKRMNAGRAAR
jgi:glycosyltransferase involved in cell wall biosynthesis